MQALRSVRTPVLRNLTRTVRQPSRRTYAEVNQRGSGGEPTANKAGGGGTTNLPLIVGVGGVAFIFLYYFVQGRTGGAREGDSPPGSGQAAYKESRRAGNAPQEYRDPRDSGVKTIEQGRIRKEASSSSTTSGGK